MRLRKQKRDRVVVPFDRQDEGAAETRPREVADPSAESPSAATLRAEIRRILEHRIDELPVAFRTVFVLREVEETARALGIPSATVRTRLFRARSLLREGLARDLDMATSGVFGFAGFRCDRIVARVLELIAREHPDDGTHRI
jgi:RNA polymerase sigma-70 factor (ECF subfamily)